VILTAGALYGRGLSFPIRVRLDGGLAVSTGELNVRESMCLILRTGRNERVERADFGCGLQQFLYEPGDLSTMRLIQEEVKRAITRWEPRVTLNDVRVAVSQADPRAVDITVVYTLVSSGAADRVNVTIAAGS
jgi:uncharacterized protein